MSSDRKLTGNSCECAMCGEVFAGLKYFDQHLKRRGEQIACLDTNDLASHGFRRDERGRWTSWDPATNRDTFQASRSGPSGHGTPPRVSHSHPGP